MEFDNPHGIVESSYQHRFSVNVWCGVIGGQLIGPYIFPQLLTGDIYANFLQELPALFEKVPLQKRRQICYQQSRCKAVKAPVSSATEAHYLLTNIRLARVWEVHYLKTQSMTEFVQRR